MVTWTCLYGHDNQKKCFNFPWKAGCTACTGPHSQLCSISAALTQLPNMKSHLPLLTSFSPWGHKAPLILLLQASLCFPPLYAKGKGYCVCMCVSMHISIITIIALPTHPNVTTSFLQMSCWVRLNSACVSACVCMHFFLFYFCGRYCVHVGPDVGQPLCFPSGAWTGAQRAGA